ncbi:MAG: glutamine synthetase III [Candidatus Enterosoma sp.]|nr:glutamine synthetase III [Candidatus Enterosoma sp.]
MDVKNFDVTGLYGVDVFDEEQMRQYLPKSVFDKLEETIRDGKELDQDIADDVAKGMKEWALNKGATHYTHWFSPLTGDTAEKHDSFLNYSEDNKAIMEFSGKELIKGEPDASSFPNGGLRATFEARGYTAWDCKSPAFVINDGSVPVLYIPTAFCSYNGDALDEKTPLLRSSDYLSKEAVRVLRLFGDEKTKRVITYAGPEQEYFLVDIPTFAKRKDLVYTGRTLFGALAPKGQELEDHYFGPIREQVSSFMRDVNEMLWKLGIPAKTEHNEVAPSQHELAVIYGETSVTADQNALVMTVLKKVAKKHGLVCLLSEKPFQGINGSGKHDNWSIAKDDGTNLLKPGKNPKDNLQFLVFLTAVIKGVDEYADLLRESVASYTNDFRLGANEAPPAIISIFLGDELTEVVNSLIDQPQKASGKKGRHLDIGVKSLPSLDRDTTDRNRTSPFAFIGNRFEFRMVGSLQNISEPNTMLNAILGHELELFANEVEKEEDKMAAMQEWIKKNLKEHQRVIFNGDGYSEEWVEEAERRGLPNLKTAVEATDCLLADKNKELLENANILSERELNSRAEIKYSSYAAQVLIDAKTMSHMVHKQYLPSANNYLGKAALEIKNLEAAKIPAPKTTMKNAMNVASLIDECGLALDRLDSLLRKADEHKGRDLAVFCRDKFLPQMRRLREIVDSLELIVAKDCWPVPSYGDLLYHIG